MEAAEHASIFGHVSATLVGSTTRTKRNDVLLRSVVLFLAYIAVAQVGYLLFRAPTVIAPVAGVAVALVYLYGLEYAGVVFLAALVSYFFNSASWGVLLVVPLAQALQAAAGAYLLEKLNFNILLNKLGDVLALMFVAVSVSTIVPTFGLLAAYLNVQYFGHAAPATTWGTWWVGMMTSILIVGAFTLRWAGKPAMHVRTALGYVEALSSVALVALLSYLLFWTRVTMILHVSLVYVLLIPLFWVALRAGPRFTTLALFTATLIAVAGTFFGVTSNVTDAVIGARLFQIEIFLVILAAIFYVLVAVEEERKEILVALNARVAELQVAVDTLHSHDRNKSEFLAMLAHELRNPLASLVSSLEVLKLQGLVKAEGGDTVAVMDNQLHRLRRLLDDLLDITRISQQKLTLQKGPIDINTVITHSLQSVRGHVEERMQRFVVQLVPTPTIVNGDATRLEQACINLLNNASKFSPPGSTITVTAQRARDTVEIHVRDTGIGIEPEAMGRIFEPFEQGRSSGRNDGIGIGLTLAKNIIEMHGGTLRAMSEGRDKGSDFVISLPTVPAEARPYTFEPVEAARERETSFSGYRVLVVDDNEMAAKGMATLLALKGYVAQVAHTGKDAQVAGASFKPHAMILDIGLPDTDGYTLANYFRKSAGFDGLLIALTGYGQEENKRAALNAGFDHHVTKPVGIADLQKILVEGLEPARRES